MLHHTYPSRDWLIIYLPLECLDIYENFMCIKNPYSLRCFIRRFKLCDGVIASAQWRIKPNFYLYNIKEHQNRCFVSSSQNTKTCCIIHVHRFNIYFLFLYHYHYYYVILFEQLKDKILIIIIIFNKNHSMKDYM